MTMIYNLARLSQSHYQEVRSCQAAFAVRNEKRCLFNLTSAGATRFEVPSWAS
jgi:hypothetical protein